MLNFNLGFFHLLVQKSIWNNFLYPLSSIQSQYCRQKELCWISFESFQIWLFKAGLREPKVRVKFYFRSESFKQKSTSILFPTIWNWMEKINPKMLLNREIYKPGLKFNPGSALICVRKNCSLTSNFALILSYRNPALNNSA